MNAEVDTLRGRRGLQLRQRGEQGVSAAWHQLVAVNTERRPSDGPAQSKLCVVDGILEIRNKGTSEPEWASTPISMFFYPVCATGCDWIPLKPQEITLPLGVIRETVACGGRIGF